MVTQLLKEVLTDSPDPAEGVRVAVLGLSLAWIAIFAQATFLVALQ